MKQLGYALAIIYVMYIIAMWWYAVPEWIRAYRHNKEVKRIKAVAKVSPLPNFRFLFDHYYRLMK